MYFNYNGNGLNFKLKQLHISHENQKPVFKLQVVSGQLLSWLVGWFYIMSTLVGLFNAEIIIK